LIVLIAHVRQDTPKDARERRTGRFILFEPRQPGAACNGDPRSCSKAHAERDKRALRHASSQSAKRPASRDGSR
jgi:hypothetical protein